VSSDKLRDGDLQSLESLTRHELHEQWRRLFKCAPPRHASPRFLCLAIAYALQEQTNRGLTASARRELRTIAKGEPSSEPSRQLQTKAGTRFLREWHGDTHEVFATDNGFVWKGKTFRSLSAVACAITGAKWNGHRFFGLVKSKKGAP